MPEIFRVYIILRLDAPDPGFFRAGSVEKMYGSSPLYMCVVKCQSLKCKLSLYIKSNLFVAPSKRLDFAILKV